MAEKSAPAATFATFSAARLVRDNATAAGFTVEKVKGFGRKRTMLKGYL
jgi:tRNA 5-methylaminomethyl-2-thiouridine biosynthesis bifunctional protein